MVGVVWGLLTAFLSMAWAGPHTLMVGVEGDAHHAAVRGAFRSAGGSRLRCYSVARICVGDLPEAASQARVAHRLARMDGVRWVERDRPTGGSVQELTADHAGTSDCPDLWELSALNLEAAHLRGLTGAGAPVVAIQDSGFYEEHLDMGTVSGRYDYGDWDTVPEVVRTAGVPHHGTFIAGEVVGIADNALGRAGVVSDGRVNLQKVADSSGALYFSYAVSAMADLAEGDLGVRVLSYSIAGPSSTDAFHDAVQALGAADILLVTAAANCSSPDCADADNDIYPMYPGSYTDPHILTVAGSRRDGALNSYSHYGASSVDLAAPGVDICSLGIDSVREVLTAGGTSYATPLVAGAAALLFEAHPDLTAVEAARVLRVSASWHAGLDGKVRSNGGLDLGAAMSTAVPRLETLPDPVRFDGETIVGIDMVNAGDPGRGVVVLSHPAALSITVAADMGWDAESFSPGDALDLPDAGAHVADGYGTVLTGPLAEHTTLTLPTYWRASADGEGTVTVRLAATSTGADYLNAPYDRGTTDETGFLAWSTPAYFTAHEALDTGDDDSATGDEPAPDSGSDSGSDSVPTSADKDGGAGEADDGRKSGCAVVATGGGAWFWAALVAARRRKT